MISKKKNFKGTVRMKCLCREEERKEDKYKGSGGYAMLKQGQREKQQEDLTGEITLGAKEGIFTAVFGEVCISYLTPFQSPEVREVHELFKLTES